MDDRTFDETTARNWIQTIENPSSQIREADLYPLLRKWLEQMPTGNIVDLGSGQGVCSQQVTLATQNYTGLEASLFLHERAVKLYSGARKNFVLGNIYAMPFAEGVFDGAFSVATWHLLADLPLVCLELARILKPGGLFFIVTANPEMYDSWKLSYAHSKLIGSRFEGFSSTSNSTDVLYLHSMDHIVNSLTMNGLRIESNIKFRNFISFLGHKS